MVDCEFGLRNAAHLILNCKLQPLSILAPFDNLSVRMSFHFKIPSRHISRSGHLLIFFDASFLKISIFVSHYASGF